MFELQYTQRDNCRSCKDTDLHSIYSVPPIPVAGIYYKAITEPVNILAPMNLVLCRKCGLVQLLETVEPEIYLNYSFVGNSADAYKKHLEMVCGKLIQDFGIKNKDVFEVGASNGVLLELLLKNGSNSVAGIEPSEKLCKDGAVRGIPIIQGYFNQEYLEQNHPGTFDCVVIRHVLEHIDDLNDMVSTLRSILAKDGLLVIEVPDVDAILQGNLFSNIFHEHLNYFSMESMNALLQRHGIKVVFNLNVDIHGGSLLLFCKIAREEKAAPVTLDFFRFDSFATRAYEYYSGIKNKVLKLHKLSKEVHGFGASHRTFVLLSNAGLTAKEIPVIYDSNTFLHNLRLNGLHSFVKPKEAMMDSPPDAIVIFATSYEKEISSFLVNDCGYQGEIISIR